LQVSQKDAQSHKRTHYVAEKCSCGQAILGISPISSHYFSKSCQKYKQNIIAQKEASTLHAVQKFQKANAALDIMKASPCALTIDIAVWFQEPV